MPPTQSGFTTHLQTKSNLREYFYPPEPDIHYIKSRWETLYIRPTVHGLLQHLLCMQSEAKKLQKFTQFMVNVGIRY